MSLPRRPGAGQRWRHYRGHDYVVVAVAADVQDEHAVRLVVVYRGVDERPDGRTWYRPLEDFIGDVELYDGLVQVQRFERVT